MRHVLPPEALKVGDQTFGLPDLLEFLINTDDQFNADGAGIRSGVRVETAIAAFRAGPIGDPLPLEDQDWERAKNAAEKPTMRGQPGMYPIQPARKVTPFVDAIANAKTQAPAVLAPKSKETKK